MPELDVVDVSERVRLRRKPRHVLAVVAHPDDEVLGCGGTLAKHAEAGDKVVALVLCARELTAEAGQAKAILGTSAVRLLGFADQALDQVFGGFKRLLSEIEKRRIPRRDLIYTHSPDDLNLDHALTARAVLTAFRPCHSKATILAFETISSTEWGPTAFEPNWFVELSAEHVERKKAALACYPSEIREPPHPRNAQGIETAARYRGAQAGVEFAEAFRVLRHVA